MRLRGCNEISPVPARSIHDLEFDEKVYKPDLEITDRCQVFSNELVRISLLGLGAYGLLIKMVAGETGKEFLKALREHQLLAIIGVVAFAICAGCGLLHGFLFTKFLRYQLVISRYFGRLEGTRWDEKAKDGFRKIIQTQQTAQKSILLIANRFLVASTLAFDRRRDSICCLLGSCHLGKVNVGKILSLEDASAVASSFSTTSLWA